MTANPADRRGFTIIEVLTVTVILSILAAVVFAAFGNATTKTRQSAFVTELHHYVSAAEYYMQKTGQFLPDSGTGAVPPGFEAYIDTTDWTRSTPVGGSWDTELNENGFVSALGVHFMDPDDYPGDEVMAEIDEIIDDGDPNSGVFRRGNDNARYYYALVE